MNTNDNRQNAHNEIDRIFKVLLPARNMAERPEQAALCHRMLDAMLEGGIALCDAGTGIGKTYAYLVAGTVYSRFRAACGLERKPTVSLFHQGHPDMVFYTEEDTHGGTMLCATIADLTAQLRHTLWQQERPAVLTSATLAVGKDFRRFKEETGLLTDSRVTESVALSPFDYQRNCLLYLPQFPPRQKAAAYYDELAKEIAALLDAAQGHALALFTSYAAMSAVKERLPGHGLRYPLFTMGRSAIHTTEQFKASPGSVLLAAGAAWEGFDFPGDCVSLLIIPRLPFAVPDALKEKERENHPTLRLFIRAVVVPEMQIKLKQGFGRAIRTETDTCVVAILDERAAKGKRYSKDVLAALPEMPVTGSLGDVARFIRQVKGPDYFREASA